MTTEVVTTPDATLTEQDLKKAMRSHKPEQVAVVYNKIDGRIEMVSTQCAVSRQGFSARLQDLMPDANEIHHELIFVPYIDGEIPSPKQHRVVIDVNGAFLAIKPIRQFGFHQPRDDDEPSKVSASDIDDDVDINTDLLNSSLEVVTHVLDQIQDPRRLIQYQLAEVQAQNRQELKEYFARRGL